MVVADSKLRVTELIASLSLATDLGTGQPLGHGLSTSTLSVAAARALDLDHERVRSVQQVALLRFIGCTAEVYALSRAGGGDDLAFDLAMAPSLMGSSGEQLRGFFAVGGGDQSFAARLRVLLGELRDPNAGDRTLRAHCEVGARLARDAEEGARRPPPYKAFHYRVGPPYFRLRVEPPETLTLRRVGLPP